jgi:hypothetical protein
MLSAGKLTRCLKRHSAWKTLNYPIYIPEEQTDIATLLMKGDAATLEGVLKRRASLGSRSAAALLGFLEIMGAFSGKPDAQAAIICCTGPAQAGDPYAQYIVAWAQWRLGNRTEALRLMKRPAAAGFLPALVDTARMLAVTAETLEELRTAVRLLWGAHKLGHVVPLVAISGIAFRGQLGSIHRLRGLLLFPYAMIRLMLGYRCDPFGIRSFCIDPRPNVPFFRQVVRADLSDPVRL